MQLQLSSDKNYFGMDVKKKITGKNEEAEQAF